MSEYLHTPGTAEFWGYQDEQDKTPLCKELTFWQERHKNKDEGNTVLLYTAKYLDY